MINPLNLHYAFNSPASIHDEEALTALELAGRQGAKINQIIDEVNNQNTKIGEQSSIVIPNAVEKSVQAHINSGDFDNQINKYQGDLKKQIVTTEEKLTGMISASENELNARMDSFSSLPSGSTSGDAELMDGRVGDFGGVHSNIGGAIRKNMSLIRQNHNNKFVKETGFYNLFARQGITAETTELRVSLKKPTKFDKMMYLSASDGYDVGVSYWDDNWETRLYDSGWKKQVTASPNYNTMIAIRKEDDQVLTVDECYACNVEVGYWNERKMGNPLDVLLPLFTHGAYVALNEETYFDKTRRSNFFTEKLVKFDYPFKLHTTAPYKIAVHTFTTDKMELQYRLNDSGWQEEVTIPANTYFCLYFCKWESYVDAELPDLNHLHYGSITQDTDTDLTNKVSRKHFSGDYKGVAHRGLSYHYPENTLVAFRKAYENGFKYVECDVRLTNDNVPVLCHDSTIDRTSNGSGSIANMTLTELKALDFGSWVGTEFTGTKIPTLEEFLVSCKRLSLHPYIEIEPECKGNVSIIYQVVKRYGMTDSVTWISSSIDCLHELLVIDKGCRMGYITISITDANIQTTLNLKTPYNSVFLDTSDTTESQIEKCALYGLPVEVWTVNSEETMKSLSPLIQGVTSDLFNYSEVIKELEV